MRRSSILFFSMVTVAALLPALSAQDRVSMSSPVIRTNPDEVSITARFQGLAPDRSYRIGVGVRGQFPDAKIELSRGDAPAPFSVIDFVQGHTSNWWGVNQLSARGFQIDGSSLGGPTEELLLRVSIPQAAADNLEFLYLFIARNYGTDVWYLEDGVDLDNSYW